MAGSVADESRGHRVEGAALALATLRSVLGFADGEAAILIRRSDAKETVKACIEERHSAKADSN